MANVLFRFSDAFFLQNLSPLLLADRHERLKGGWMDLCCIHGSSIFRHSSRHIHDIRTLHVELKIQYSSARSSWTMVLCVYHLMVIFKTLCLKCGYEWIWCRKLALTCVWDRLLHRVAGGVDCPTILEQVFSCHQFCRSWTDFLFFLFFKYFFK